MTTPTVIIVAEHAGDIGAGLTAYQGKLFPRGAEAAQEAAEKAG